MNYLENMSKQNWKQSNPKSICRLMALNEDIPSCNIKEQQIDQIRKKLLLMCKNKGKENFSLNLQNQLTNKIKDDHLLTILFKEKKLNKCKQHLPTIEQKQINLVINNKQIKLQQQALSHRKVKTEIQEGLYVKQNKTKKHYPKQFRIKKDNNIHLADMSNFLSVKTEKMLTHKKFWNRFAINQKLQVLKQNTSQAIFYHRDIQQNQNQNQIQVEISTYRSKKIIQKFQDKTIQNNETFFSNLMLKEQINLQKPEMLKQNTKKRNRTSIHYHQRKKKFKNYVIIQDYRNFVNFISLMNGISLDNFGSHKFYVIKGNNEDLIRRLMKKRKWQETLKIQEANFVWGQKRVEQFMRLLSKPCLTHKKLSTKNKNKNKKGMFQFYCQCSANHQPEQKCFYQKLILIEEKQEQDLQGIVFQHGADKKSSKISIKTEDLYQIQQVQGKKTRIHNHLKYHQEIAYKKLLFLNLKQFYEQKNMNPFQYIPLTFHVQSQSSESWQAFMKLYEQRMHQKCLWIVKPGENTNRGVGIKVQSELSRIKQSVSEILNKDSPKQSSVIIQQYIMPLLYNTRKFDIRCYLLVTIVRNRFKAYWYQEGYVRTSCKPFSTDNIRNKFVHLTNDAVQKFSNDYGKYEPGNKLSFQTLAKYIQKCNPSVNFNSHIYPCMVSLAKDAIEATHHKMHEFGKDFVFQIFGLDFMIDEQCKTWLIEINRNPCLETSTSLLARLISEMVDNAIRIAVDPILPMPNEVFESLNKKDKDPFSQNKFRLIFERQLQQNFQVRGEQQQNNGSESSIED